MTYPARPFDTCYDESGAQATVKSLIEQYLAERRVSRFHEWLEREERDSLLDRILGDE